MPPIEVSMGSFIAKLDSLVGRLLAIASIFTAGFWCGKYYEQATLTKEYYEEETSREDYWREQERLYKSDIEAKSLMIHELREENLLLKHRLNDSITQK